ncbi:MAG TPA: DUF4249 domain-containing protein, partial [Cytophagales bacterium]|nr:DUF4249 domain-containing protein [Cytophagales bacterium]
EGARLVISDDEGNEDVLTEERPGEYLSDMVGILGRTYTLNIQHQETSYEGSGTLLPPAMIDSVIAEFREENSFRREGYFVTLYGQFITPLAPNFYRMKVWRNDTLYSDRDDYQLLNDLNLIGALDGLGSGHRYRALDTVRVEIDRLNEDMFNYYVGLIQLLYNDGGLFSPPPINPPTTLTNLTNPDDAPLGFFQVSSRVTVEVTVPEEE